MVNSLMLMFVMLHQGLVQGLVGSAMIVGQDLQVQFGNLHFLSLDIHSACVHIPVLKRCVHIG